MESPLTKPPSPGTSDISLARLTTSGSEKEDGSGKSSSVSNRNRTLNVNASNIEELKILHIEDLPASCDYEIISTSLCSFGKIMEIRMNFLESDMKWEAWVIFENHEEALKPVAALAIYRSVNQ